MIEELIRKNRSRRRFHQGERVELKTLRGLVDLARISASGANLQPLKYILSCDPETNARVFQHLAWAGYLKSWPGPDEGERPAAYIVILCDTAIAESPGCDHGIAAQSIMLGATELGLGGCIIASVNRDELRRELEIADRYYHRVLKIPSVMWKVGTVHPKAMRIPRSRRPGLHSSKYAPHLRPSLRTGIITAATAILTVLSSRKKRAGPRARPCGGIPSSC
jgi:nitroreductase